MPVKLAGFPVRKTLDDFKVQASSLPQPTFEHFLPDQGTAVSLINRLLHHAVVVVTSGESFRMREARSRGGMPLKKD